MDYRLWTIDYGLSTMFSVNKKPCIFLDRDGVLNEEIGRHVVKMEEFRVKAGVPEGLKCLKAAGYLLVVITNQSGIARGYYDEAFVRACYEQIQTACGGKLDGQYFAPGLDQFSRSLMRKPDSLMFEKAIARFGIDPQKSWMAGDKERDLIPARKLGIKTIQITQEAASAYTDVKVGNFLEAVEQILKKPR